MEVDRLIREIREGSRSVVHRSNFFNGKAMPNILSTRSIRARPDFRVYGNANPISPELVNRILPIWNAALWQRWQPNCHSEQLDSGKPR
jgi:hypothetical protein